MIKVIMIEDDVELAEMLTEYLNKYNISVTTYTSGLLAIEALKEKDFDLLILDLTLPGIDGLDICKHIPSIKRIPIIISSARRDVSDKVLGLESGADDYLPKPYDPRELVARIHSVLRRNKVEENNNTIKEFGSFKMDANELSIFQNDKKVNFTPAEFEIVKLLLENQGKIVRREQISRAISHLTIDGNENSINVIMSRIRQKIGDSTKETKYIESVRGVGYRFIGV